LDKKQWPDWEIYKRDRCRCVYCGFDGTIYANWRQLQIDHLVPRSADPPGSNDRDNKVVSCAFCNLLKGAYDPREEAASPDHNDLIQQAAKYIYEKGKEYHEGYVLMMLELGNDSK